MANDFRSARWWAAEIIDKAMFDGAVCVDATLGNGHDTLRLCTAVGEKGHVYGFDIQQAAVDNSRARLEEAGVADRATLICDGHQNMERYVAAESADAILFNLGWLPGAEHGVTTMVPTTLAAVEAALRVLKEDGVLTICVYPGHGEGAREREALIEWAKNLDETRYDAFIKCYLNQSNDPPLLIAAHKMKRKKKK